MGYTLRDYQVEALAAMNEGVQAQTSQLLVLATGLGKTLVAAEFIKKWETPGDILFIAHRKELLKQTCKTYERLTGETAYLEQAENRAPDQCMFGSKRRVVVGSVQSLVKRLNQPRFDPKRFSLIITDECHRGTAGSYLKVYEHFGILDRIPEDANGRNFRIMPVEKAWCRSIGLTATPNRTDNEGLDQIFGAKPCYEKNIKSGIDAGYLVNIEQKFVEVQQLDLDSIKCTRNEHGDMDFTQSQLEELLSEEGPLHEIAHATLNEIGDRQAIVFAAGVTHAQLLVEVLNRRKHQVADVIWGSMPDEKRVEVDRKFKNGTLQILVNVAIAVEGYDVPETSCVVMAAMTKSLLVYTQRIGRGTRTYPGCIDGLLTAEERLAAIQASPKKDCLVIDFVGASKKHKLITSAHVLTGEYSVRLTDLVVQEITKAGGGKVTDFIDKAETHLVSEIRREARKKFIPKPVYEMYNIPIFEGQGSGNSPVSSTRLFDTGAGGATDKQIEALGKMGIRREVAAKYKRGQAGAILDSLRKERCSNPQAYQLRKFGYDPGNFNFHEAKAKLDELFKEKV